MFDLVVPAGDALLKKFETFRDQLDELHNDWPDTVVEWQKVDMHRKYPLVAITQNTPNVSQVETMIYPRSRLELVPGYQRPYKSIPAKGPRQVTPKGAGRAPASSRPILRLSLFQKLHDRMAALVTKATTWPST
jgi:hypothetical protein